MIVLKPQPPYDSELIFLGKDAALLRINVAMTSLLYLAADLHAYNDTEDDLGTCSRELEGMLARMCDVGQFLVTMSDPDTQAQVSYEGENYNDISMGESVFSFSGNYEEDKKQSQSEWSKEAAKAKALQESFCTI